jgi:uncharacterized oxidoreductase
MQMTGNTILITGGGSGIGRALAEAFHALGNTVIIAGRRRALLDEVTAANPGMHATPVDLESAEATEAFATHILSSYPALNAVIHNAGIMRAENVLGGELHDAEAIVATNLLAPIRLTAALLPHLVKQPHATIMTVTSGLAFMPLAITPTYCATKAAMHSYTESLRYQLKNTSVQVIEIAPPWVQTELMGPDQATEPRAMPLAEYIAETMANFRNAPDANENLVERVKPLRFAEANGSYGAIFRQFNDAMSGAGDAAH